MTGRPYGKLLSLEGGGKKQKTPDYTAAAEAQGKSAIEAARIATKANRVNQVTPFGTLEYSHSGSDPDAGWTATQTLSPEQMQQYQAKTGIINALLGNQDFANSFTQGIDFSQLPETGISGQSVQDAVMSRLQPQIDRDRNSLDNRLANQGIFQGSEAYRNAQNDQAFKENDQRTQAALQGISTALQGRQQGIQEQIAANTLPLNMLNALQSGAQVQGPGFINTPVQQATAGTDYLGATTAKGQFTSGQNAANQSFLNGLVNSGLSAALLGSQFGLF